jgi:hypothetical protein
MGMSPVTWKAGLILERLVQLLSMHDYVGESKLSHFKKLLRREDGAIRWMEHAHPIQGLNHGRHQTLQREWVPL